MIGRMSKGPILAPSILSADFLALGEAIHEAEAGGADWIHIDVMDGHFVPNLTIGPVIVQACRHATSLPLDVHLMIERPEGFIQAFADAGADSLTVHAEAGPNLHRTLGAIHALGLRCGVAINPGTPVDAVHEVLLLADLILVMTVNPGFSGQAFIESALEKVSKVKAWREEGRTEALIQVDGGIDAETAPLALRAGADVFVAATAVFRHPSGIQAGLDALRASFASVPA